MEYTAKTDLTKNALANSLKKAIVSKPINKITINEIAKDAGFNRQTFYYHFDDIYHLLSWMLENELLSVIIDDEKFSSWQSAGLYLLEYLRDHHELSMCLINAKGSSSLKTFFYNKARSIVRIFLRNYTNNDDNLKEEYLVALSHYYSISFAALLEDWISQGMSKEPRKVIAILDMIVTGTTAAALGRFSESDVFDS